MSQDLDPIVASAERLCETLERIGDALVSLDTQTLLETEETLGRVLAALASGGAVENKAALEPLIGRGREALGRVFGSSGGKLPSRFFGQVKFGLHVARAEISEAGVLLDLGLRPDRPPPQ